jgi:hypothetical protein
MYWSGNTLLRYIYVTAISLTLAGCGDDFNYDENNPALTSASGQQDFGAGAPTSEVNAPPMISGNPVQALPAGGSYVFLPLATDGDGDQLTFSVENLPQWAAFDAVTGAIAGVPDAGDIGTTNSIVVSVSDGLATTELTAFSITVTDANVQLGSVTLQWAPPTQNEDGSTLNDLAAYRIYYGTSPDNLDQVLDINNPGIASYVVENLLPSTYYFGATAINADGIESDMSGLAEIIVS